MGLMMCRAGLEKIWGLEKLKFYHLRKTLDSACDTGGVVALNLQLLLSRFYPHLK